MRKIVLLALLAGGALAGRQLRAAGFGLYEVDAASTAMGGHVIASPRNASSVYYNPGAMGVNTSATITVGMTVIRPLADARIDKTRDVQMDPGWIGFPTFFLTAPLPWGLHFGFGSYADFGIASQYPRNWELKHDSIKTQFEGYTLQAALSWDITDKWSIGAGPRFTWVNFETQKVFDFGYVDRMMQQISGGYLHAAYRGRNRLKIQADNEDDIGIGLTAGTRYRLTDDFALGATFRSRVKTRLKGTARWSGDDFGYRNSLSEEIQLPAQVSLGFNWDDALWVEGLHLGSSVSWIEWSKMHALRFDVFKPDPIYGGGTVQQEEIKLDWHNTYRAGFGLGYDLTENWDVMAGYVYDWDPSRNMIDYSHTMLPVGDRHIATTGLSWRPGGGNWEISLAYALVILESKTQMQKDEYYKNNHIVHRVHNHHSYTHLVSIGVSYSF